MFEKLPSSQAHRTTILINKEDWAFLKKTRFKPTSLLRVKIKELKRGGGIDWEERAEKLALKLNKTFNILERKLPEKEFIQLLKELNR